MNNQATIHLDPPGEKISEQRALIRHLPNALTILRILLAPVLYWLIMNAQTYTDYVVLYYLFVFALSLIHI